MKHAIVTLLAGTALAFPQLALAQEADQPADDQGGIEEIVVTAQKRSEGLSRVPISIAAVTGKSIESYGQANMEQVSSSVPNLRITQTGIANRIAIRGIASGDNKGFEQSAAMFVDGIYFGRDQLIRMPLVDVQRIEVLRGPQPTLFGKNAIAGAVSVINRTPSRTFEGSGTAQYEFNHHETQLTGMLSGPISEMAAFRLVGYYRKMDGYMTNSTLGGQREPQVDTAFVRGMISLGEDNPVTATLKLEYADFKTVGTPRENFSPRGVYSAVFSGARAVETNLDWRREDNGTQSRNKVFNTSLNVNIKAGDHALALISGYLHYKTDETLDVDFTGLHFLDGTNQGEEYDQLSQELRVTSPDSGRFKYIIGTYFQTSKLSAYDHVLFHPYFQTLGAPFSRIGDSSNDRTFRQTSDLWSAFAQGTLSLTDQLRVTAGVRYNTERKTGDRKLTINAGPTNTGVLIALPGNANYPVGRNAMLATFEALKIVAHSISGKIVESATTPMVNVQFDVSKELMLYGAYARGVKAGGFDIRSNALPTTAVFPGAFQFRPEKADNFEGGFKYKSRNLAVNVTYYNTKYKDLQTNIFDGTLSFNVRNASGAKVQGVEADARVGIGDHVQLSGSIAYLDYKFTDFTQGQCPYGVASNVAGGFCNYNGQTASFAPKWTGNAAADFNFPVGDDVKLSLNLNVDFSSSYHAGNVLDPYTDQAAYAKIGARLGLGSIDGNWEIALIGRNLNNKRVLLTAGQVPLSTTLTGNAGVAYSGIYDRPRNVALQVQGKF